MAQPATPEQQQYLPHNKQIPPTTSHQGSPPGGSNLAFLPFTGLDLGVMAMSAVVLLACGFGLKRLTRGRSA
jgi:hypothetical protein